jgi:acetylornithine deacetylase/succinyl-diaminopimelate desuccinylase family protein
MTPLAMEAARAAIRAFLQRERQAQARFLAELVKTASDNPPGDCAPHAMRAATLLENLGLAVERHPVPEEVVRAHGMVSAVNLVIRKHFGDGPTIALNAHGDVVPPGEGWSTDPYGAKTAGGWMMGRGVAVSKSDFATYAFALLAVEQCGVTLQGTVELHFTYDEETGGEIGPERLLKEGISRPDFAICAGFSYSVVTAHNGCLHLEVEIKGRSAHSAMPFTGIDALEAANEVLTALYAARKRLSETLSATSGIGSPQLTVGLIKGGINTNVVPDRVTLRLDRRIIPEEDPREVEAELRTAIEAAVSKVAGARVAIDRILLAKPLVATASGEKLVRLLCAHATDLLGEPVTATGVPLYTDARHYAEAGIPVVLYGAGPHTIEEANAHRANERLPLRDLYAATEVIALTLLDLLAE